MFLVVVLLLLLVVYLLLKYHYGYWERKGIVGPTPSLLVGNMGQTFLAQKAMGQNVVDAYYKYPNASLVGIFRGTSPCLIVRDPEIVKDVLIKDFLNFHDNDIDADVKLDPLIGRNPFFLKGAKWKAVRTLLTPCFTSVKMRVIYPLLEDVSERLVKYIASLPHALNGEGIDAKEVCVNFTLNNVASCAFGVEGKCFEDPHSEFKKIAHGFLDVGSFSIFKVFLMQLAPWVGKIVPIKFVPQRIEKQLEDLVAATLQYRKENNVVRQDFLHMMNQLRETMEGDEFSDVDIAAQCAGFFLDGYETSSETMTFLVYELAANPEAQTKLREEIYEKLAENNGQIPYDVLMSMPYLAACFDENLRMHHPLFTMVKRNTSPWTYKSKPGDGVLADSVTIERGTTIYIPVHAFNHDPKYHDDHESFRPERFLAENKETIQKAVYLPFGSGPRACLGERFGRMQLKAGIVHIIKNYELSVNSKTQLPLRFNPVSFLVVPIGGLWVNFKKIQQN